MVIKCTKCDDNIELKPIGMTDLDQFLYDFNCPTCGTVHLPASLLAFANWDSDYVNRKLYPVVTQYVGKMLTCDIKCIDCEFRRQCYKGKFFYDIDKDELKEEHEDDD